MELQRKSLIDTDLPDIAGAWKIYKEKRVKQHPQNNLRASSIGHPCERYHFYSIHDWREKTLHDAVTQSIFDEGSLHETDVLRQLTEMGFKIVEQQRSFQFDNPLVTGSIDGILLWNNQRFPFDIKSISPFDYTKINSAEDMINSPKTWHKNYPGQLQLYMLMAESEIGCFILKNKLTGEIKPIWMEIDFLYADDLLKKAERVYKSLKNETLPERINSFDHCSSCPFSHICLPDLKLGDGVKVIDDAELSGLLERRETLLPAHKEFETLDKEIKDTVTIDGVGEKICGDFLVRIKEYERTTKVALTWEEKKESYLRTQILKLDTGLDKKENHASNTIDK